MERINPLIPRIRCFVEAVWQAVSGRRWRVVIVSPYSALCHRLRELGHLAGNGVGGFGLYVEGGHKITCTKLLSKT